MPIFEYTALSPQGKTVKGTVDSENVRAARQKLRSQGVFPTDIKEGKEVIAGESRDIKKYFRSERITRGELSVATRQLATLTNAGLPLVSALQALSDLTDGFTLKRIVIDVREKVQEGLSLAKALANFPKVFPQLYINMIAAGEASGTLDGVLNNLADYLEAQVELRRRINSALMYPIIMLIICTLVIVGLLVFVVPRIVEIFEKQNATLPWPTQLTIGISNFIIGYWFLIAALFVFGLIGLRFYYQDPRGREKIDRIVLKIPIYGAIYIKIVTSRVARTLGTLLASGVGLLEAIQITRAIVTNVHFSRNLEEAEEGVRQGRSLAKELSRAGLFPSLLSHMIAVGEKSGELEQMLVRAGDAYEKEVKSTLSGLTSLIEPLMIVVVGAIVLWIVISVLLPMVDLMDVMGR